MEAAGKVMLRMMMIVCLENGYNKITFYSLVDVIAVTVSLVSSSFDNKEVSVNVLLPGRATTSGKRGAFCARWMTLIVKEASASLSRWDKALSFVQFVMMRCCTHKRV